MSLKVLIVSSHRINCGIASYSEVLRSLLETEFEVTIAPLDQTILKRVEPHVVKSGDQQIKDLCASFKDYDVVNLQWEPGLLGGRGTDAARRFAWLLEAADNLILTVHTAVPYPAGRSVVDFLRFVRRRGVQRCYRFFFEGAAERATYRALVKRSRSNRNFIVAAHTERERQFFKHVVGVRDVFDHPLSHLRAGWPERLAHDGPLAREELQKAFPGKRTFIGVFGFLSEYKGIATALRAMKHLEGDHHLLIYGGVHPEAIKQREPIDPYVEQLLQELEREAPQKPGQNEEPEHSRGDAAREIGSMSAPSPREATLLDKVTFIGAPSDDYDFAAAVNAVDICIFPYLEVGQSGSGPASHAIELGKPTILTRTKAFVELEKYFPKQFEMVDVGNYIQLAQTIHRLSTSNVVKPPLRYNSKTLAAFYGNLIRRCAGQTAAIAPGMSSVDKPERDRLQAAE